MPWRIFIWIFIFISGFLIDLTSSRGVLTIWLLNYKNVKGRTYDGSCCDYAPTGSDTCPDQCDYVMRCIVTGLGRANDHVFLFHRPIKYDSNDISFEDESSQMTQLTILFDEWPTTSSVKMDVFFYDYDDFDHTTVLVDWFETPLRRSVDKGEKQVEVVRGNRQMDKTRLEFKWSVHCFGTNDCLKPPPEWNIWPWAAESRTYAQPNLDSNVLGVSSNYQRNFSKSMTTLSPTQRRTTVKIFNKDVKKHWVEVDDDDTLTQNAIDHVRSPFSPFSPHTNHGDILNGQEKKLDAREHAKTIDAEERLNVPPASPAIHTSLKQIKPIADKLNHVNKHKKNDIALNNNLIESIPTIDNPFATDVPVVRDELLKEIYEKVAVELANDVNRDAELSSTDYSKRLHTIIAETEIKTGALPKPRNPYIDRYGEHIKLPNLGQDTGDPSTNPTFPGTSLVNATKPRRSNTSIERIPNSSRKDDDEESTADNLTREYLTIQDVSSNTVTDLPKRLQEVHKHRTQPPPVRKWDKNYNWKEHYKDYVLPKQHLAKVKTHVWAQGKSKYPIKRKKFEPVSRTGAKKYPESSLNRLKEARENSSIEIGYYRQLHTDFISKQNDKRRKEKAKMRKASKPTTAKPKIKVHDVRDFSKDKTTKIPMNAAPINPFARKRKPYQATLRLDSGFTDWSKDLRTKVPPVNPSVKGPMTVPDHKKNHSFKSKTADFVVRDLIKNDNTEVLSTNDAINDSTNAKTTSVGEPNHFGNGILKPKPTKILEHLSNDVFKYKTPSVNVLDHFKNYITNIQPIDVDVPDHIENDIIPTNVAKTNIIKLKPTNVAVPDYVKTDIHKSKTTNVNVPDHFKNDIIKLKPTNVTVPDYVKTDIHKSKTTNVNVPDHFKKDIIKLKPTNVAVPDYVKNDIRKSKPTNVDVPDHFKNDIIIPKPTNGDVPDNIIKSSPINVAVIKPIKKISKSRTKESIMNDLDKDVIIRSKPTNVATSDFTKSDIAYRKAGSETVKTTDDVVQVLNKMEELATALYPVKGDVIKSKTTNYVQPKHVQNNSIYSKTNKDTMHVLKSIKTGYNKPKTLNGITELKEVKLSNNIRPLPPPSRTKVTKSDKKSHSNSQKSDHRTVSLDSTGSKISKVFYENNRSSFSVGPFFPEIDTDRSTTTKDVRSTTIHSWIVFDNRLLPQSKQSSKRPNNRQNTKTPKKKTDRKESTKTKSKKKSEDAIQVKPTKVSADPTKFIQTSSVREALEKLNPKKSPFHPKRKLEIKTKNSPLNPYQTTQANINHKKIPMKELSVSESTNIHSQKSILITSKLTEGEQTRQTTIPSVAKSTGKDFLVINLPKPPNVNTLDSGPQMQGAPTIARPKSTKTPIVQAILTPVPTKTTKSVLDITHDTQTTGEKSKSSRPSGLYIDPGGGMTTKEYIVTAGPISTQSTLTSIFNRFTPKDRGGLFETFKSLSEIIRKASRKGMRKTYDNVKTPKVESNIKESPFSPYTVEIKSTVSSTTPNSPRTIQWIRHSPKQLEKDDGQTKRVLTTQTKFPTSHKATLRHASSGPTSPSQSPVIVVPNKDVIRTTTVSQMNIFEFLPNAIKEIYFGKAKEPNTKVNGHVQTVSVLENVRLKPTTLSGETDVLNKINNQNDDKSHRPSTTDLESDPLTKRPLSSDLDIINDLGNGEDVIIKKVKNPHNPFGPTAPEDGKEGEILNYIYHDPKVKLKGTNFLFNNKDFDPKKTRTTIRPLPRPLRPTTRHKRPVIPTLPSHRYFVYTRLGSANIFTTTSPTTKHKNRLKIPALPTHRYFAFTRKNVPTTTKQPDKDHFGSFIEHGKVKLVSKQGREKAALEVESQQPQRTTKTGFPNSAASKTFNPYHHFKSNTPSPRFPTKSGDIERKRVNGHQTTTKQPYGDKTGKGLTRLHLHPDQSTSFPSSKKISQYTHWTDQTHGIQSTKTTEIPFDENAEGRRRKFKQSTQSIGKFGLNTLETKISTKPQPSNSLKIKISTKPKQSTKSAVTKNVKGGKGTKSSEDTRRTTNINGQSTTIPYTVHGQSKTFSQEPKDPIVTISSIQISKNPSYPRLTTAVDGSETSVESNRKVTITSNIFRWIYDLSKALPDINKPVPTINNTVKIETHNNKVNTNKIKGSSSNVADTGESKIFNFFDIFQNLTNTDSPKIYLTPDRTKKTFGIDVHSSLVKEGTLSTRLPIKHPSTGNDQDTKKISHDDGTLITNKADKNLDDSKQKGKQQIVPHQTTQSERTKHHQSKINPKHIPKISLKSRTASETTATTLEPTETAATTLEPRETTATKLELKKTQTTTMKTSKTPTPTSKTTPKPKQVSPKTSTTVTSTSLPSSKSLTTMKIDEKTTTVAATTNITTTQVRTTTTTKPTTPKKIELTLPPWLKITTLRSDRKTLTTTYPKLKSTTEKSSPKPTTKKTKKPTVKKPKLKTTKKPKLKTTKKPKLKTTKKPKIKTTKKPKIKTTKKPKTKTTQELKITTTQKTTASTSTTRKPTTRRLPRTRKPVNITINMDHDSNNGPRIIVPNGGLFIPQPRDYNSSGYGYPGGSAKNLRLQVRKMNFKTVFNRYWPAILGLTVGTVFLVAAVLTSVACRQQRLYIRRTGWTDMPHHVSEPPDTSEYSSAASLVSDATRSSISFH